MGLSQGKSDGIARTTSNICDNKGGATIAMTNFVGLSTSLIVKHGFSDCTPEVISGPETTSACWLLSCTGPATSSASSPSTNILNALLITNQTLLLF